MSTIISTNDSLRGVAYDTNRNKLYLSSFDDNTKTSQIHRCDATDGSHVETWTMDRKCKSLQIFLADQQRSNDKLLKMEGSLHWRLIGSPAISTLVNVRGACWRATEPRPISAVSPSWKVKALALD